MATVKEVWEWVATKSDDYEVECNDSEWGWINMDHYDCLRAVPSGSSTSLDIPGSGFEQRGTP